MKVYKGKFNAPVNRKQPLKRKYAFKTTAANGATFTPPFCVIFFFLNRHITINSIQLLQKF